MAQIFINGNYKDEMGNTVIAPADCQKISVEFRGRNNTLIINENSGARNTLVSFPSDSGTCIIGAEGNYCGKIRVGWECTVIIGSHVTCTTACAIYTAERTCAIIGDDCMLAAHVIIRTEDSHAIYDIKSGERTNSSRNIFVGQHVWLAEDAILLSGTKIGAGSVIAVRSVVKGALPNNVTAAGIPCKVIKKNTAWERPNIAFNEPWVRSNAKIQNLVESAQTWKLTGNQNEPISLGRFSYNTLKSLEQKIQNINISDFSE
ncbi:acyltransferase [Pseudomonas putida]|uniref:acyltransferase n=1 Tax=Pseudomonas putida TaxID=303 RepID=UPI001EE82439|nr:acyltransferase [Pseudomonas putida]